MSSYYYAEVKRGQILSDQDGRKTFFYKLIGLHDTTSKTKPTPAYGGDDCIPISELAYNCLHASRGSINRIKATIENLEDWLEGDEQ